MKRTFSYFLPSLLLLAMGFAWAPRLYYNDAKILSDRVVLQYEISNPGYVELHLMGRSGDVLWIKGKVHDESGEQTFEIPRKPLELGERYSFTLKYKGRDYGGSFYNEG